METWSDNQVTENTEEFEIDENLYIDGLATYRSEKQGHYPKEQN